METDSLKILTRVHSHGSLRSSRVARVSYYVLLVILLSHVLVVALLCFTPPISRDALIHHLGIPKLWLKNGGFYETPWAKYSYYPMNIDLLYLVALYFKNDIAPKFIHFSFALGTGLLIYLYLKKRFSRNWGLLGAIIFLTTPIVVRLSASAYIDLGMTFFITGSILGFVKWRDSGYNQLRWLIVSSCCMGIALGSKYNALIAWLFLNLIVTYGYAKDKHRQLPALEYGFIFFAITALIASPWYVKNYILTGNPFYPLFEGFFGLLDNEGGKASALGAIAQGKGVGFFQRRQMMYGEDFWETLLIPVRMFFQGKDDSYQYFDGMLNPILVVFLPFSLMNKDFRKDKIFFFAFSGFFIIISFFLTAKQVRYILPAIPFLAILAVMGIENIVHNLLHRKPPSPGKLEGKTRTLHFAFHWVGYGISICVIGMLLILNLSYLKSQFTNIQPLKYVLNKESRQDFLTHHLGSYPAMDYINNHTSTAAKVLFMFIGNRGYYLDRTYHHDGSFGMESSNALVRASHNKRDFLACLQSLDCTHILVRTALFHKYLKDNFQSEQISRLLDLTRQYWKSIYESSGYVVYEIQNPTDLFSESGCGNSGL